MNVIQSLVAFLGRALLSFIFISSAIHKIIDWAPTMQFFTQTLTDLLAVSVGSPHLQSLTEWCLANTSMLLLSGVMFELVGGLLVFLGLWTRLGALLLILFLIPTTIIFHHFWLMQGQDNQMQMINFMKNVSICGGLLFILAMGKGTRCSKADDKVE